MDVGAITAACAALFQASLDGELGHYGLAGTNVALQQTIHGMAGIHVGQDLFDSILLVIGQFETAAGFRSG